MSLAPADTYFAIIPSLPVCGAPEAPIRVPLVSPAGRRSVLHVLCHRGPAADDRAGLTLIGQARLPACPA